MTTPHSKRCAKCGETKPREEFNKDRIKKSGLSSYCRTCDAENVARWYRANTERVKEKNRTDRLRRYNLTRVQYHDMFRAQGGRCALCAATPGNKRLSVDHDHDTEEVRGLLCILCNRALERIDADRGWLVRVLSYVRHPPARKVLNKETK